MSYYPFGTQLSIRRRIPYRTYSLVDGEVVVGTDYFTENVVGVVLDPTPSKHPVYMPDPDIETVVDVDGTEYVLVIQEKLVRVIDP